MENEMKQTAVEWLIKEYSKYVDDSNVPFSVLEKAKEMEKEQIMEAHYAPKYGCFNDDYYNETFKTNEK